MVFEKVQAIIADQLNISKDKVTMDSRLIEDLEADSLDAVEIITVLEDEYNVEVDDEAIQTIKTVGDLVKAIEALK